MHELSIAQALVEQVEELAAREGAVGVKSIRLRVGGLSGVEPEALELAFPVAAEESRIAGALLEIVHVPARVRCRACGSCSRPDYPLCLCADCGSSDVEISAGRELEIESVELSLPVADPEAGEGSVNEDERRTT